MEQQPHKTINVEVEPARSSVKMEPKSLKNDDSKKSVKAEPENMTSSVPPSSAPRGRPNLKNLGIGTKRTNSGSLKSLSSHKAHRIGRMPKCMEPTRNKTHWDYLLQEMAWMATDFHQELKWKMAAAKVRALESLRD